MPSISLTEIIILAIVAGLLLLVGGLVLAIVIRTRRGRSAQADPQPGPDAATSRSSNPGKWLLLLGLAVLLAIPLLPLVVAASGILMITPVKSTRIDHQGPAPQVQVVAMPTPMGKSLDATPTNTPRPTEKPGAGPIEAPPPEPASPSITPDDGLLFVALPGIAGLAVLFGLGFIAVVLTRWRRSDPAPSNVRDANRDKRPRWDIAPVGRRKSKDTQLRDRGIGADNRDTWARTARLRYAPLVLAIWLALSIYLVLDAVYSVSVYFQFVAIYAIFWVLIGLLLLIGSPRREKLLILGLFVVVLFSTRAVNWNSRKPFLRDLYRVKEGMAVEQVEQIMGQYMRGGYWPSHPLASVEEPISGTEEPASPDIMVYRHTSEGWGDSDWGEIRFEEGRVVEIRFLPD
jgi:hypothetical protein